MCLHQKVKIASTILDLLSVQMKKITLARVIKDRKLSLGEQELGSLRLSRDKVLFITLLVKKSRNTKINLASTYFACITQALTRQMLLTTRNMKFWNSLPAGNEVWMWYIKIPSNFKWSNVILYQSSDLVVCDDE